MKSGRYQARGYHLGKQVVADDEPTKSLCIGPDTAGNRLELLFLQLAGDDLVIHAMPLRPVFRTYLTGEDS